ncbi:MAG: DUF1868 domain-containing protein [Pseudomonadota bacterium]|nr:DUF1868 domain-containing protein [Pseudomonadota bacterium]
MSGAQPRLAPGLASEAGAHPPVWLGNRFDAEGTALPDRGATVIGHVRAPAAVAALSAVHEALAAAGLARFWAFLPPTSFHMTQFDLVLHNRREAERWPEGLAPDLPAAEADAAVTDRLRGFATGEAFPFRLAVRGLYASSGGMGVALAGETPAEDARLRAMRDRIAARTGLAHRPGRASYPFHISLAYLIAWPETAEVAEAHDAALDAAEAALLAAMPVVEIGAPEVCVFDDKTEFRPLVTPA